MGCDIHAMWERKKKFGPDSNFGYWMNAGDPDINRNYELFAILGDVRNEDNIPYIARNRFDISDEYWYDTEENECSSEFMSHVMRWEADGHSHSWVSLKELKEYDTNQTYNSTRLVSARDENGKITETCAWSSGETFGEVGETTPFALWGDKAWTSLLIEGERIREQYNLSDDEVRLVFFFDN